MVEIAQASPVHLKEAIGSPPGDLAMPTLAAFLLAAGIWHRRLGRAEHIVLPPADMAALGLAEWTPKDGAAEQRFDPRDPAFREAVEGERDIARDRSHELLRKRIEQAYETRSTADLAQAVIVGAASTEPLLRVSALISMREMFRYEPGDLLRRLSEVDLYADPTTAALASMLMSRLLAAALSASLGPPPRPSAAPAAPGLMLIHGTNFPPHRPGWSVPGVDANLFKHIAGLRADLYGAADYFRWEGGYSDYAREVAAANLDDWIARRKLGGIDAVTHSHGGNVLMESTHHTAKFGKALLLSCPVRWSQYQPRPGQIATIDSVRVKLDLVIMGDRAGQAFPIGSGITETVLPIWFDHSATTMVPTWAAHNINRFI